MTTTTKAKARRSTAAEKAATPPNDKLVVRTFTVLVAVVVVIGATALTLFLTGSHDEATQQARTDALVAAEGDVKDLLSYDYQTLDHDVSAAQSDMTPRMAASYSHYWSEMRTAVTQAQTVVQTVTQAGGVVSASPDKVTVLLFVEMLSVNKSHPKTPEVDEPHLTLVMEKQHGKWLIAGPLMSGTGTPPGTTMSPTPKPSPHATR